MNDGFVVLWRTTRESEVFRDAGTFHLFVEILLTAAWKAMTTRRRTGRGVIEARLNPGELLTTEDDLAKATGASRNTVHARIANLKALEVITTRPIGNAMVVSVTNWLKYQVEKPGEQCSDFAQPNAEQCSDSEHCPPEHCSGHCSKTVKEQEGHLFLKTNKTKGASFKPEEIELPPELGEPFREAWRGWCAWRRDEHKKPITPSAARLQLKQLASWGLAGAIASVEQSIRNEWRGLFPVTQPAGNKSAPTPPTDPRPCGPSGRVARF